MKALQELVPPCACKTQVPPLWLEGGYKRGLSALNVIHLSADDCQVSLYTGCPTKGRMGAHGCVTLRNEALSDTLQKTLRACWIRSFRSHASMLHLKSRTREKIATA